MFSKVIDTDNTLVFKFKKTKEEGVKQEKRDLVFLRRFAENNIIYLWGEGEDEGN